MKTSHKIRVVVALGCLTAGAVVFGSTGVLNRASIEEGRRYVTGELAVPEDFNGMAAIVSDADSYCDSIMDSVKSGSLVRDKAIALAECVVFFERAVRAVDQEKARPAVVDNGMAYMVDGQD